MQKLVDKLKSIDTAFSLGILIKIFITFEYIQLIYFKREATNGNWCIQFGMVTAETDVKI